MDDIKTIIKNCSETIKKEKNEKSRERFRSTNLFYENVVRPFIECSLISRKDDLLLCSKNYGFIVLQLKEENNDIDLVRLTSLVNLYANDLNFTKGTLKPIYKRIAWGNMEGEQYDYTEIKLYF